MVREDSLRHAAEALNGVNEMAQEALDVAAFGEHDHAGVAKDHDKNFQSMHPASGVRVFTDAPVDLRLLS